MKGCCLNIHHISRYVKIGWIRSWHPAQMEIEVMRKGDIGSTSRSSPHAEHT